MSEIAYNSCADCSERFFHVGGLCKYLNCLNEPIHPKHYTEEHIEDLGTRLARAESELVEKDKRIAELEAERDGLKEVLTQAYELGDCRTDEQMRLEIFEAILEASGLDSVVKGPFREIENRRIVWTHWQPRRGRGE